MQKYVQKQYAILIEKAMHDYRGTPCIYISTHSNLRRKSLGNDWAESLGQLLDLLHLLGSQTRRLLSFDRVCPNRQHLGVLKLKLDTFAPVPDRVPFEVVVRAAIVLDKVVGLLDARLVRSAELSPRRDGDGAVPGRHGEGVLLRNEGEGELGETGGAVDGEPNVVWEHLFDGGGEGLKQSVGFLIARTDKLTFPRVIMSCATRFTTRLYSFLPSMPAVTGLCLRGRQHGREK
jgi:hypothetical protein